MLKIILIQSILFFIGFSLGAVELPDVLKKMNENYASGKTYHVDAQYKLYKGHDSGNLVEQYSGFTENSKSGFYQKIDQSEKIITNNFFLHINHSERALVYGLPVKPNFNGDIQDALKYCATSNIVTKGDNYILTFTYSKVTNSEFSKVKMIISKDKYLLKSIDLYYATLTDFSKEFSQTDYAQSHVRMNFNNYSNSVKTNKTRFNLSTYIKKQENHMLKTVGKCSGYELIDIRTNQ